MAETEVCYECCVVIYCDSPHDCCGVLLTPLSYNTGSYSGVKLHNITDVNTSLMTALYCDLRRGAYVDKYTIISERKFIICTSYSAGKPLDALYDTRFF